MGCAESSQISATATNLLLWKIIYMSIHHPSNNGHYHNGQASQQKSERPIPDHIRDPLRRLQDWVNEDSLSKPCPIPTPQELAEYEKVFPGAAEQVLELAEKGHKLHTLRSYVRLRLQRRLIWLTTFIACVLMSVAAIGVFRGSEWYVILPFALCGTIPFIMIEIMGFGKEH